MNGRDDDATPAPPHRSSVKISQWGIAQAWLAGDADKRRFIVESGEGGELVIHAVEFGRERESETVGADEDVSRAAVRALSRMK